MTEPMPAELVPEVPEVAPLLDALLDVLAGLDVPMEVALSSDEVAQATGGWRIADDGAAEWAMRKLAKAEQELAQLRDQYDAWADQLDTWLSAAAVRPGGTAAYMRAQLEAYAVEVRAAGGPKTVRLPSGEVPTRAAKAKVVVADPDGWLVWAEAHPNDPLVRRKLEPVAAEVAKLDVESVVVGWEHELHLACTHVVLAHRDTTIADAPTEWPCPHCPADAIDGQPVQQVLATHLVERTQQVVTYRGDRVPWAGVEPEHVTANAKPVLP